VPREGVAVVRALLESYNAGNLDEVIAHLDPDIEWCVPPSLPLGGVYRGHDAVRALLEEGYRRLENPQFTLDEFLDADEHVVYLGQLRARTRDTARQLDFPVAFVWTLHNGKATRMREYSDTAKELADLGLR
jgi:ketosteroid isomerase-like protein